MSNIRTYRVNHAMQMISIPLHSTTNSYHLGNNDEVVDEYGYVSQVTNYYPFGAPYADATAVKNADFQPYKYNGKELDLMHGLNTYDYGARQHDPILARWDRIDPLCEKYYNVSPYAYCLNNPVKHIDPDGKEVGLPEEMAFGARHPIAACRIGPFGVVKGSTNISTNATRFATRGNILYGSNPEAGQDDRGSENGAMRHALWQATITSEFGNDVAAQAGDAHEDNPNIDWSQTFFKNLDSADRSVDLHNNIIGRSIGLENKGAGMKTIAIATLKKFAKEGLYEAQKVKGGYKLVKVKLDSNKYKQLLNIFNQLNDNGFTNEEQQKYDNDKRYKAL